MYGSWRDIEFGSTTHRIYIPPPLYPPEREPGDVATWVRAVAQQQGISLAPLPQPPQDAQAQALYASMVAALAQRFALHLTLAGQWGTPAAQEVQEMLAQGHLLDLQPDTIEQFATFAPVFRRVTPEQYAVGLPPGEQLLPATQGELAWAQAANWYLTQREWEIATAYAQAQVVRDAYRRRVWGASGFDVLVALLAAQQMLLDENLTRLVEVKGGSLLRVTGHHFRYAVDVARRSGDAGSLYECYAAGCAFALLALRDWGTALYPYTASRATIQQWLAQTAGLVYTPAELDLAHGRVVVWYEHEHGARGAAPPPTAGGGRPNGNPGIQDSRR